jgi:hypothetical protein
LIIGTAMPMRRVDLPGSMQRLLLIAAVCLVALALGPSAEAATYTLRPNADISNRWSVAPHGRAWAAIDDPVSAGAPVTAADYIWSCRSGRRAQVALADRSLGDERPTTSRAWFYANTAPGATMRVAVLAHGRTLGKVIVPRGAPFAWRSIRISPSTQSAVSALTLRFTSGGCGNVRAAYVRLSTSPRTASVACGLGGFRSGHWPTSCWRPYSDSSPFNRAIPSSARVAPHSAAMVARLMSFGEPTNLVAGQSGTSADWYHPTYYATGGDPRYTLHCTEPWGRCAVEGIRLRVPAAARPAGGGDAHMTIVDQAGRWEYDLWGVSSKPAGGGTVSAKWGGKTRIDGDGRGSDATAARFGNLAGVIRGPELAAGHIDHALFMTIDCDSGTYVYPAMKTGRACSSIGLSNRDAPPMGSRFQLNMSSSQIDALAVPAWKKTILHAMATYGMYFGDTGGGTWGLQFESGSTYTSFGVGDPVAAFARANGVPGSSGHYAFNLRDGVDWAKYLRVIDPCTTRGAC